MAARNLSLEAAVQQDAQADRKKLWSMVQKHKFAMMTTLQNGEELHSRPMTTIEHDAEDSLWFFAAAHSSTADDLSRHPQVCLTYADTSKPDFVCVSGHAKVVADNAKKRALWSKGVEAWFPQGPDSSDVVLVQVAPHHAEYWDTNSSKLVQLFRYARAAATGNPPRNVGEHRDVPLGRTS